MRLVKLILLMNLLSKRGDVIDRGDYHAWEYADDSHVIYSRVDNELWRHHKFAYRILKFLHII